MVIKINNFFYKKIVHFFGTIISLKKHQMAIVVIDFFLKREFSLRKLVKIGDIGAQQ